jgi:hypothetical protein
MKAIIEFNLDDYHERKSHIRAIKATDVYLAVHDTFEYLRKKLKYEDLTESERILIEDFQSLLSNSLAEHNVDIYEELE